MPHFAGGSAEAYPRIADMLARERDKAVSVAVMARLAGARPDDLHAQSAFAQLLARAGQTDRALQVYEKVLSVDDTHRIDHNHFPYSIKLQDGSQRLGI